jgi:hypothetical protein
MALPGRKKQPDIKQKSGKKAPEVEKAEDAGVEELKFEQIRDQGQELKNIREAHAVEQLEKIKKQRLTEKPKKVQKGKGDTRIDVEELVTETEDRKGGMPEHIAALSATHPIRVRWEKGFRQREDGTWYKLTEDDLTQESISMSEEKQTALLIIPLIVLGLLLVIGGNWYVDQISDTRKQIFKTVRQKEMKKNDPKTKAKLKRARDSSWLPELTGLLEEFKKVKSKFTSLSDNAEGGSYIKHIKKHNKKFDPEEAMRWRTRIIRKPSD